MSQLLFVPRAGGGTLLIQYTPAPTQPPIPVTWVTRDNFVAWKTRDNTVTWLTRDNNVTWRSRG